MTESSPQVVVALALARLSPVVETGARHPEYEKLWRMGTPEDDDQAATKVEEVPAFARDPTEAQDDGGGDVFSNAGEEATAGPPPAETDVGEMPTELREMDLGSLDDDEPGDTQNLTSAEQDEARADETRADPVEDISLDSLDAPADGESVFSDSSSGSGEDEEG